MPPSIRLMIVEDNVRFREGLKYMLGFSADFECLDDFGTGKELLDAVKSNLPDVVLMDIDLPGMSGRECTRHLKQNSRTAHIQVMMLTILENEYEVLEAILAVASGYILKSASPENILYAIRQVKNGGSPMSPSIARCWTAARRN